MDRKVSLNPNLVASQAHKLRANHKPKHNYANQVSLVSLDPSFCSLKFEPFKLTDNIKNPSYFQSVYDVTRRETFTNLSDIWAREVELYSTNPDCIKMLVGNKVYKTSYSYLSLSFLSIKQLMRRSFTHNDADTGLHQMKFPLVEKNAALFLLRHDAFQDSERAVTREEGIALAKECGCLFLESS
ncbi:hypothetical protein IFM89_008538 [Coptis chinensis]|uniref:Uncharacterized protein n=1 Tax=Coptis chinensis TaxID=261450 RepID=A0A835I1G2_9MAGN|nr:hypothetical protein IFM89_008538 [Coptis chinensis]